METKLSESVPDTLTNRVWDAWSKTGITSRYMTWMELHKLAEHFLKICREQERDHREFDFYVLIDSNLNYTIYINGTANINGSAINGTLTNVTLTGLTNGSYQVTIQAYDDAGNYANSTSIIITV